VNVVVRDLQQAGIEPVRIERLAAWCTLERTNVALRREYVRTGSR